MQHHNEAVSGVLMLLAFLKRVTDRGVIHINMHQHDDVLLLKQDRVQGKDLQDVQTLLQLWHS